jgi:hypothetical protein
MTSKTTAFAEECKTKHKILLIQQPHALDVQQYCNKAIVLPLITMSYKHAAQTQQHVVSTPITLAAHLCSAADAFAAASAALATASSCSTPARKYITFKRVSAPAACA